MAAPVDPKLIEDLAAANRILADQGVFDAFGHVSGPRPPRPAGRPTGWAPSSIREVLHRDLYRGLVVWNKRKKRDQWGVTRVRPRPAEEWVRRDAPDLRIVEKALWHAAHQRIAGTRQTYLRGTAGRLWGRPANGIESKYLLTGLAACGWCGGTLEVRSGGGRGRPATPFQRLHLIPSAWDDCLPEPFRAAARAHRGGRA